MPTKADTFNAAVQNVNKTDMSNIDNWLIVHATKFLPRKLPDGRMAIPTTAMVSNFDIPRATIHTTLNHVVNPNSGGNWNDRPYIIIAPYKDAVALNGNPDNVSVFDTYFMPNPDTGMVLPKNTHIVMPSAELRPDELIRTDGNYTYYNSNVDKFTNEQITQILDYAADDDRDNYKRWSRGEFESGEIIDMTQHMGPTGEKMYENARDKQAFVRGMFKEAQYDILALAVRQLAVNTTVQDMGYATIEAYEGVETANVIADTAIKSGIRATPSNKGHSVSVPGTIEDEWNAYYNTFYNSIFGTALFNISDNWDEMFQLISEHNNLPYIKTIRDSLIANKPIDFWMEYNKEYNRYRTNLMYDLDDTIEENKLWRIPETLDEYNPNLAETLRRNATQMTKKFKTWQEHISKMPGYDEFITRLKQLQARDMAQMNSKNRAHDK